jgi:PPM family protein phosphatase
MSPPQEMQAPAGQGACISWHAMTQKGFVRTRNEDAYCVESLDEGRPGARYLLLVADGLGGYAGGETASRIAMNTVRDDFRAWAGSPARSFVSRAITRANQEVFNAAYGEAGLSNMQTTTTAVVVTNDTLTVGHVGDCRLYHVRDGTVSQLTRDHSLATDLKRLHAISDEDAEEHWGRHQLTRSVGHDLFLRVDVAEQRLLPGDSLLLCSDGLWPKLSDADIVGTLQYNEPERACKRLEDFALRGSVSDNITAVVFRVLATSHPPVLGSIWRRLLTRRES